MHDRLPQGHITSLNFWEISYNISQVVQDWDIVAVKDTIGNHMWPIEWHHYQWPWRSRLLSETFLTLMPQELSYVLSMLCLHMNWNAHVDCKFSCLFQTQRTSQGHMQSLTCEYGSILETVLDGVVVVQEVINGLSNSSSSDDLEWLLGPSPIASLFKCDFFIQLHNSWQDFNWHSALCDPSVIAELLVSLFIVLL